MHANNQDPSDIEGTGKGKRKRFRAAEAESDEEDRPGSESPDRGGTITHEPMDLDLDDDSGTPLAGGHAGGAKRRRSSLAGTKPETVMDDDTRDHAFTLGKGKGKKRKVETDERKRCSAGMSLFRSLTQLLCRNFPPYDSHGTVGISQQTKTSQPIHLPPKEGRSSIKFAISVFRARLDVIYCSVRRES